MSEKRRLGSLSIFGRVLLMMVVVALIPLGGLIYISGFEHQRDWRQNVNRSLELTADALAARVDGWIDTNLRALRHGAVLPDIVGMETARQKPVLEAMRKSYEWSYLVFTVLPDGKNIGRSDDNPLTFYGDRSYFQQVIAGRPVGQEVLIGRTSGKPALILAGPVGGASGQTIGVIAMAMHLTDVSETIAKARIGETGYAILVDEKKKAIAHGRPQLLSQVLQDLTTHPALVAATSGSPVVFEEDGRRVVAFTRKTSLGWTLIVQQDYDEAFAPLLASRQFAIILIAVALLLVVVVAFGLARQLARPLVELTKVAEGVSRGDFQAKVMGTERGDEIGALARAVERMAMSIRMVFERLRKKS